MWGMKESWDGLMKIIIRLHWKKKKIIQIEENIVSDKEPLQTTATGVNIWDTNKKT